MTNQQIANQQMRQSMPEGTVQQQREAFAALLENLGQASPAEARRALDEHEEVAPEPELDPEVVARLRQRIADTSAAASGLTVLYHR